METTKQKQTAQPSPDASTVATTIGMGLRDPQTGKRTAEGKQKLPKASPEVRRAGVQAYQREQGGSAPQGGGNGVPQPPTDSSGQSGPQGAYPSAPSTEFQPPEVELPDTVDWGLSSQWLSWAVKIGKFLVRALGDKPAQEVLAAIAGTLGRRINPDPMDPMCVDRLIDRLPEEWRDVIALWQCGAPEPYGITSEEGQLLWLALQVATGSFDIERGTHCKCTKG